MSPAELADKIAALDVSNYPLTHQLALSAAVETLRTHSNVIALPVTRKNRWTTLHQLDGRPWATSTHFGPDGAWGWVVETVAHEHGVSEDQVGSLEGSEDQYDNDDLVTIDGLPVYRIRTSWK